jgi:hypothetical protein
MKWPYECHLQTAAQTRSQDLHGCRLQDGAARCRGLLTRTAPPARCFPSWRTTSRQAALFARCYRAESLRCVSLETRGAALPLAGVAPARASVQRSRVLPIRHGGLVRRPVGLARNRRPLRRGALAVEHPGDGRHLRAQHQGSLCRSLRRPGIQLSFRGNSYRGCPSSTRAFARSAKSVDHIKRKN